MPRLSMNEMTTYRWSFERDVAEYKAAGFPALGVWRQKLSDYGEDRGIDLLAESGLAVSNLLWAGGFTGSDGRSLRESVDDACDAARLAAAMGAECLVVYTGSRAGHTHSHARRLVKDALVELAPLVDELELTLALEPMHAEFAGEWTFLTTIDDALNMLAAVGSRRLKLAVDTYHLGFDPAILPRLPELVEHLAIVHLGDGYPPRDREQRRSRLGEGQVPLEAMLAALAAAGYEGYYDVELIGEEIENTDYHDLLGQSRRWWETCKAVGAGRCQA